MLVRGDSTDITTYFVLRTAADGTATTGAVIANIDLQYVRSGEVPVAKVDAVALAATDSVHTDNNAIEIDAVDQPGLYRVDWPDAAFASDVKEVILTVKLAASFTEHLRAEIDAPVDATSAGSDIVTITINDGGGLPIGSTEVWITTDIAGDNVVAGTLTTNDLGQAVFMLDAGSTYYRWAKKVGYNFTNPTVFVAVSD